MLRLCLTRCLAGVPALLLVTVLVFTVVRLIPGDPARILAGDFATDQAVVELPWLPAGGTGSLAHLILPAVSLGLFGAGVIARQTRSSMLETLGEDFVRTARAKGLTERVVVYKHAFKNALIPVVTVLADQF